MRISDWSSDVCSSDLGSRARPNGNRPLDISLGELIPAPALVIDRIVFPGAFPAAVEAHVDIRQCSAQVRCHREDAERTPTSKRAEDHHAVRVQVTVSEEMHDRSLGHGLTLTGSKKLN